MEPTWLTRVIAWYRDNASKVLVLALLLTLVAGGAATRLTLNADFEHLLPQSAPSLEGLTRLKTAYGKTTDRLSILIQGEDPAKNEALALALEKRLERFDEVVDASAQKPAEFFERQRLLYLELEDLKTISKRLKKRIRWERKRANPLFVSLDNEPPSTDMSDITKKYEEKYQDDRFFHNERRDKYMLYLEMSYPAQRLDVSEVFLPKLRTELDAVERENPGAKVSITGRYIKRLEQRDATTQDLARGTALALSLIAIFLITFFRAILPPIIVTIPLLAGSVWSFAWAYLLFGSLNMLTGFLGSVLLGLGIDYGIHLVSRYREALEEGLPLEEAIGASIASAGRASLYAGLTTLVALGSLATSSFQAFYEFGLLALGGLTLILLAYATVLPCLLIKTHGTRLDIGPSTRPHASTKVFHTGFVRNWRIVAILAVLATVPVVYFGGERLGFEYDFHRIMPSELPSMKRDALVLEVESAWRTPSVVLAEDRTHALAIKKELEGRMSADPKLGAIINQVTTIFDLLPEQQDEKLEVLKALRPRFEKLPKKVLQKPGDLKDFYDELVRITDQGKLTPDQLPAAIARMFTRADDPGKSVVLVFPSKSIHDARDATFYSNAIDLLPDPTGAKTVRPINEESLMRDILDYVTADFRWMFGLTVIGIILITLLALRSLLGMLLVLMTLGVGISLAMGLIGWFDIKFNFINIIVFPIWLGLGVDAVFHMIIRLEESNGDRDAFRHTVGAVFAAFATTMIGFGSFMISSTRGLASLGYDALIGLLCIFFISVLMQLLFLPKKYIQE